MRLNRLYLFCLLLLPFTIFPSTANNIYFSKIGIEQGLSQLSVNTIYQDELGMMWFGTREGASRYNGNTVRQIKPMANDSNSLVGNVVKTICGDKNGTVYIYSFDGINAFDLKTEQMRLILRDSVDAITYGINNLWIAYKNQLFTYKNGKKSLYLTIEEIQSPISCILQTSDQRIIVGTISSGIYLIDPNQKYRLLIPENSQTSSLFEDAQKNIWVGTWQGGLYKVDRTGKVHNYRHDENHANSISANFVRTICQDNHHNLWIGTIRGLDKFNIETATFQHYTTEVTSIDHLSNESVWSLYKDPQGTIWIGTYFGGVNYFNPEIDIYKFHNLSNGFFQDHPFPVISSIVEDKKGRLFLSSEGHGLIVYNPQTKQYQIIREGKSGTGLSSNNIKTAYYDEENDALWLGTHLGYLTLVNLKDLSTVHIVDFGNKRTQSNIVRAIIPYKKDLLIATYNGLFLLDKQTHEVKLFSETLHQHIHYYVDVKIMGDDLWIASQGLHRFNLKTESYESYFHSKEDENSISNNFISKLLIDKKQRLWIATSGGGLNLYNPSDNNFTHYNSFNFSLQNDYISNLMESDYGYIYIATTSGLSVLDPENGSLSNYASENGFPLNSLFNGGMALLSNDEVYIAGMNGMVSFFENDLAVQQSVFDLHLVNLWVNNHLVMPGDDTGILKTALPFTQSITLTHKQSMVTFEFATNNYVTFNKPLFRYRLEGMSDTWNDLPIGMNRLNFMNLNPGSYRLHIQALSQTDRQVIVNTYLKIKVLPPIYRTWYAYLFYALLFVLIAWRYIAFIRSKLLLKTSLEFEKKQKEQMEEVNQSKLRFFTNISHEFRTPLTLISGQVDMLMQSGNVQPSVYNRVLNIKRNTLTMQNLINELLEFRKSEQGHLSIKAVEKDLVEFLYEVYLSFSEYANYRQIKFNFTPAEQDVKLWFDPVQMQKVMYNLISNAFKYTPKNGSVTIKLYETAEEAYVEVIDSGVGIDSNMSKRIFDRFYQAENGLQISNLAPGTGIGLALTKNIVEIHGGTIQVDSIIDVGTTFTIILKKGKSHLTPEQLNHEIVNEEIILNYLNELDTAFLTEMKETQIIDDKLVYTMLIVEDNDELREMLKQIFEPLYNILTASDGQEGLDLTLEHQPDIVLSDLMMPKMSGSEMCSRIKNNLMISHIPVVLLTAQTAVEYNIEGLRLGADDYVTKPFNVKTLITRCNNLVNNRKILQEKFSKQIDANPLQLATNQLDREFLDKAQQVVEQHLEDSTFDVPAFSAAMAMGRTKLFSKIKGITGQTPNDFILNIRLKKSAHLLLNNPEYNITDITYMLGFSSPKYFSKCFKDLFGTSPSVYRKTEGQDDMFKAPK